jgi:hypothetical protein
LSYNRRNSWPLTAHAQPALGLMVPLTLQGRADEMIE